jgi:hypothetical protein
VKHTDGQDKEESSQRLFSLGNTEWTKIISPSLAKIGRKKNESNSLPTNST